MTAIGVLLAGLVAVAAPTTATAAPTYVYKPGDPLFFREPGSPTNQWACTGGYVIRGMSGTFITTAGHCWLPTNTKQVWGTGYAFGQFSYRNPNPNNDSALITEYPGNDAHQTLVDPLRSREANLGFDSRVRGSLSNAGLDLLRILHLPVQKMGKHTGWTRGYITSTVTHKDGQEVPVNTPGSVTYYCVSNNDPKSPVTSFDPSPEPSLFTMEGDSGAPVFWVDGRGRTLAVGLHSFAHLDLKTWRYSSCFLPIETLLRSWGAELPAW